MSDESRLDALAAAVLASDPVDWDAEESRALEADRAAIRELRLLARVAAIGGAAGPESPAPRSVSSAGASPAPEWWGTLKLVETVGRGAFGEVFRAWDTRLEREVALKLLPPSSPGTHPSAALREARGLARVRHPNVVTVHGADEIDGRVGLWTEFVSGRTLEDLLKRDGPVSAERAARAGVDVCRALAAVHAAGLLHGDIKAQNVMCEDAGRIVLMDFGMVRSEAEAEEPAEGLGGTPLYMAPELVHHQALSVATDVYAVGVLLYRLVTGLYPVAGRTIGELRAAHASGRMLPLREARPDLSLALADVIDRALAHDPEARFETAEEMERALAGALAAIVGPDPAVTRKRLPGWAVAAAAAAILAALVFAGSRVSSGAKSVFPPALTMVPISDTETSDYAAISPDGQLVAFPKPGPAGDGLWVTDIATGRSEQVIPPARGRLGPLTISTDSRQLFYGTSDGGLYRVPTAGGAATKIMANVSSPVSFSPNGTRLAFVRKVNDGETALVVAAVDGSAERTLATRKAPEFLSTAGPAWSPDGRFVACGFNVVPGKRQAGVLGIDAASGQERWVAAERWQTVKRLAWLADGSGVLTSIAETAAGPAQVWLIPYPAGAARRLTGDLSDYGGVTVSNDSGSLVVNRYQGNNNVWVLYGGDSNRASQTTNKNRGGYSHVSWTPDGRVVYPSSAGDDRDIWVMNADGTGAKQLTRNAGRNLLPSVTADGRYIVFASDRPQGGHYHLWRMDADGQHPVQLTFDDSGTSASSPSPDGRWVVFVRGDPTAGPLGKTLWKIPIDGGSPVPLTTTPSLGPDVSPDGRLVAAWYKRSERDSWQIAIIPLAGGPPIRLLDANRHRDEGGVRWSSDGRAVMFVDTRAFVSNLWSQPIDGGPPKKLTQFSAMAILGFDVRQDGAIVCSRQQWTSEVVLLRNFR